MVCKIFGHFEFKGGGGVGWNDSGGKDHVLTVSYHN